MTSSLEIRTPLTSTLLPCRVIRNEPSLLVVKQRLSLISGMYERPSLMSLFRSADPGRSAGSSTKSCRAKIVTICFDDSRVNRSAFYNAIDHERPLVLAKTVSSAYGRVKNLFNNVSPHLSCRLRAAHIPVTSIDDATLKEYLIGMN